MSRSRSATQIIRLLGGISQSAGDIISIDGSKLSSSYIFDASAKRVTINDSDLDTVIFIENLTDNIIIYNPLFAATGGTQTDNILDLTYDTTQMSDGDQLLIMYLPQASEALDENYSVVELLNLILEEQQKQTKLLQKILN